MELPRVPGGFRTILADPPWPYDQPLTGNARGGALKHYETMTMDDIMALTDEEKDALDDLIDRRDAELRPAMREKIGGS